MKTTKTQLIELNARLLKKAEDLAGRDERMRKEFSKVFAWYDKTYGYSSTTPRLPSWEEVFTEVGKLLAARSFYDFEGNISELQCKLETLEKNIRSELHPNLPQS